MASGGVRNRNGAIIDPNSSRSDRRGIRHEVLDSEGFKGAAPKFPLPRMPLYGAADPDTGRRSVDERATRARQRRELSLWKWAWTLPQAIAWAEEPWRWHTIAMWVRTAVICESPSAMAADKNSLHRFADQIGLTPAGLSENGWQIGRVAEPVQLQAVSSAPAQRRRSASMAG